MSPKPKKKSYIAIFCKDGKVLHLSKRGECESVN